MFIYFNLSDTLSIVVDIHRGKKHRIKRLVLFGQYDVTFYLTILRAVLKLGNAALGGEGGGAELNVK